MLESIAALGRARVTLSVLAVGCLLSPVALAQNDAPDWNAVEIRVVPVAERLYMLVGRGGNIGLCVGQDGAFVIDDQFAPLTDKIKAAIATVTDAPVRFVVNTHWHGDHTGGNENFGATGSLIVAHENVRRRLNPKEFADLVGRSNQAPDKALPVVTFSDRINFHWNGYTIHVQHVEHAHTDGDAIIWFREANVVHMGDNLFVGMYPFIDVDSGGNVDGMIAAADRVLEHISAGAKLIPGHGPLASLDDLRAFRDMLADVRERVQALVQQGSSLEEVIAARPSAAYDEQLNGGEVPERFLTMVYRSLTDR